METNVTKLAMTSIGLDVGRVYPADATEQTAGATRPTLDGWAVPIPPQK